VNCSRINVSVLVSGAVVEQSAAAWGAASIDLAMAVWPEAQAFSQQPGGVRARKSIVFEHWVSGATHIEKLIELPAVRMDVNGPAGLGCRERLFCNCGASTCSSLTGYKMNVATPTLSARRLSDETARALPSPQIRRLAAADSVASEVLGKSQVEVIVIYGIEPPEGKQLLGGTPDWAFDPTFDPSSPWSQRAMLRICSEATQLKVLDKACWISDFRDWLLGQDKIFPVERFGSFQDELKRFMLEQVAASSGMWLNEDGDLRATSLFLKVSPGSDARQMLRDRDAWRAYIASKNADAATSASKAWATCKAWVEAEAYVEALSSTWVVTGLSLLAIACAGLLYTMDAEIIACVVLIAVVACVYVCFFMLCIFQWSLGPWELVMMTVFFTYTIEPLYRIGRDFVVPQQRLLILPLGPKEAADQAQPEALPALEDAGERKCEVAIPAPALTSVDTSSALGESEVEPLDKALRRSVKHQTAAVMTSAVKLLLCCILLLPCKLQLFFRLGAVGIIVALLMAPCTLLLLPAILLLSGRTRREPDLKLLARRLHDECAWLWT